MPYKITSHDIALVFMATGVLSVVLNEPLAKLDRFLVKGGPQAMEQQRLRMSKGIITVVGLALIALALALVVIH